MPGAVELEYLDRINASESFVFSSEYLSFVTEHAAEGSTLCQHDDKEYSYWPFHFDGPKDDNNVVLPIDNVRHPAHYTTGKIEVKDFIADKDLNYFRGCVVKYVVRAGLKDPEKTIEDLEKAKTYIEFEIERIRNAE